MAWTKFHLDCLITSMRTSKAIYPDALPEITEGLRAAVNAYSILRQGIELRSPSQEPIVEAVDPDSEEMELLWESTFDASTEAQHFR